MTAPLTDLSRVAVHTVTNKPLPVEQSIEQYAERGFGGVCVWDDVVDASGAKRIRELADASGLRVPALVRGGFFVSADSAARDKALESNRRRIAQAAEIGAEQIVLVVGAEPGTPLDAARGQVQAGLEAVLPDAEAAGIKLSIEPLHPMYAADRSCVNRLAEARALCEAIPSDHLGVAVDVYHVWWDPDLETEIERLGRAGKVFGFHVCDWKADTGHLLLDRGLMGDGVIDIRGIRAMVERAGFDGLIEIEIFSEKYWAMDQNEYLDLIAARTIEHV